MKALLKELYQDKIDDNNILGIVLIEKDIKHKENDQFNLALLIIVEVGTDWSTKHYEVLNQKVEVHFVNKTHLGDLVINSNDEIVNWLIEGEVIFCRSEFINNVRRDLKDLPNKEKQLKMTIEYSYLIRNYYDAKRLFSLEQYLDSYQHVFQSLIRLARLTLIEKGIHPHESIWTQIQGKDPEIYKLYNELISGEESLEKRIELLLLAMNFAIGSKTESATQHLFSIMKQKKSWSFDGLLDYKETQEYAKNLKILIDYLVQKGKIDIIKEETEGKQIFVRLYEVKD